MLLHVLLYKIKGDIIRKKYSSKGKTIDLINGDRLCELLREYKLGIKEDKNNEVKIDKEFFQNI